MTPHDHIDELVELYALGTLSERERANVDAHVGSCDACAARLGEAELLISQTLADREPSSALDRRVRAVFVPRRSLTLQFGPLVAAAFVLGLLPGVLFGVLHHPAAPFDADRGRAINAMVDSHFSHAQFTPLASGAPKAKVLYARSGRWRFFVAQTNRAYAVEAQTPSGSSMLGTLRVSGDAAELFVPDTAARTFLLLDGRRPVARVKLP